MNHRPMSVALSMTILVAATCVSACSLFGGGGQEKEPSVDPSVVRTREALNNLQNNPNLVGRAPLALKDAEVAVLAAEQAQSVPGYAAHLAYLAERRVQIARAQAEAQRFQAQLDALRVRRESGAATPQP